MHVGGTHIPTSEVMCAYLYIICSLHTHTHTRTMNGTAPCKLHMICLTLSLSD